MSVVRTLCGAPRAGDEGARMTVYGWVDRRRDQGGLIFLDLRDRHGRLAGAGDGVEGGQREGIARRSASAGLAADTVACAVVVVNPSVPVTTITLTRATLATYPTRSR